MKRTRLSEDWTAYRSDDERGRETLMIATPELARVWEIFASPYVAYTERGGEMPVAGTLFFSCRNAGPTGLRFHPRRVKSPGPHGLPV